jgi:hypothetical protein
VVAGTGGRKWPAAPAVPAARRAAAVALGIGHAGTPGDKNCGEKNVAKCATAQGLGNAHAFPPPDFPGVYAFLGAQEKNCPGIGYLTQKLPGVLLGYYDSDEKLAFDPAKDFANETGCKEAKPKAK